MRVLLLSDIHSNLSALESVLADAHGDFEAAWVLGDTVGYGADPAACIRAVRDIDALTIAGNHEMAATGKLTTRDFNPVAREAIEWTADVLDDDELRYLSELPLIETAEGVTLAHGSPRDPTWEYLETAQQVLENLEHLSTSGCVVGHTHIPFAVVVTDGEVHKIEYAIGSGIKLTGDRVFINPGSVGQPRDRDPRASFAILDTADRVLEFRRVEYDISRAQARIREEGLPDVLANRLSHGQ